MPWCSSQELTSSSVSGWGTTGLATSSLDRWCDIPPRHVGIHWRGGGNVSRNVIWVAVPLGCINDGILAVGPGLVEHNAAGYRRGSLGWSTIASHSFGTVSSKHCAEM